MSNGNTLYSSEREQAQAEWRALAPLIASQPRVRLSKDGGKTYRDSGERDLTDSLPSFPAAVRTCGRDGLVRTICLDLDIKGGGTDKVNNDYLNLRTWFSANEVRWIEDQSPSGGRHLYIPLNFGVAFTEAKEFVQALAKRHTSLDPGPHENASTGAIRVPGSVWKKGGYQRLTMSLNVAYEIARAQRNNWTAWAKLYKGLEPELALIRQRRLRPLELIEDSEALPLAAGPRPLSTSKEQTARTGNYDPTRYNSPSEARQGVLASAAAAGWTLVQVQQRMHQNVWAGMTAFYSRYSPANRSKALRRDWQVAVTYVREQKKKQQARSGGNQTRHKSYTSPPNTHPPHVSLLPQTKSPAEYEYLLSWRNALALFEQSWVGSRAGLGIRLLLRAMGEAAAKTGSRFIEFGVRSLAVAVGVHETTVAKLLRQLSDAEVRLIRLAREGRGVYADMYELVIPDCLRERAEERSWRPGKIHALRPVFRELGSVAAFAYEAIEQADLPLNSTEIARIAGLSSRAVTQALELMAAWNMIQRIDGRWRIVHETSLELLAERFGVQMAVAAQLKRYSHERSVWHQWLLRRSLAREAVLAKVTDEYEYFDHSGPPDETTSLTAFVYPRAS
ncbi:MarR family transcriptional regulator [Arthrobacter mangrovi]|uniref:Uncharacterized protein n=1 Tax=Arthrobacter mangrovi TaxID=2966350 RepID=A0ABQ5MYM6_9MICC|nr:MarR family transcriptional regulator [Arthrobacter mangrovi]GLB69091.1 hypothetical protein AHIS1636_35340 [Arthrobacter mangrovi]